MAAKQLFIFGLGYSSLAIAGAALKAGFSVGGTTRDAEKCAQLRTLGIDAFVLRDGAADDDEILTALACATHILSAVPTVEGQGDVILPFIQRSLPPDLPMWFGYLSTTGVYGDYAGAWVDEGSDVRPNNARLQRRVAAEKEWLARGAHVFRLAGIYGPGRNAVEDVLAGEARRIDKPGQVFSRIHVADISQVVLASMFAPSPSRIYNLCDDEPVPQREVVEFACELVGRPLPPLLTLEQANLSAMGQEFYSANRRVRNERIKQELDITLFYPSYREGLRHIASGLKLV